MPHVKDASAPTTAMQALLDHGQSVWLDYLRRGMTRSGELGAMIERGLRGMTSNPTIFEHAIGGSSDYDEALLERAGSGASERDVFDALALADVREAADAFRRTYDESDGRDGFVSIEVSPELARDTEGSIAEAHRLWAALERPNVMIKIPGTREGWPAIERCLADGININITLLFTLEHYSAVAEAYLRALEARVADGRPIARVASVASLFVSRVDTEVDKRLEVRDGAAGGLKGQGAIANARLCYDAFRDVMSSERWRALEAAGGRVQRPLWASTSTKNPAYRDVRYVEELIGADTVTTVPPDTLRLFEDHGAVEATLPGDVEGARRVMEALGEAGVDIADVNRTLEEEGIEKFARSYEKVLDVIGEKIGELAKDAARPGRGSAPGHGPGPASASDLAGLEAPARGRLEGLAGQEVVRRIWARDPTVWSDDPTTPDLADRLGWLDVGAAMARDAPSLRAFADEVRGSFERVVLCGMGGSSLAPEVLWRTFGRREGYPRLSVLDSTDPRAVAAVGVGGELAATLFLISSKSGTTQETTSLFRHFWKLADEEGSRFVAITDPGTPLEELASERGFRRVFLNPPDIGGRYSALSYFGLLPAALIGVDVAELLRRAHRMSEACASCSAPAENPGAWLGAVLGEAARAGRDKLTFVPSPGVASFGLWAEQLIAESTGKEGRGIVPIADEPLGGPDAYGSDRVFVALTLDAETDADAEARLDALASARHPVVRLRLRDRFDLGAEFLRWEFATAVAGAVLGINPFDQPNVAESKRNTERVLSEGGASRSSPERDDVEVFLAGVEPGDYVALLAYVPPTPEHDGRLREMRLALRARLGVATTAGYGPRYLHSTGQLHKGGPPTGHFVQIVDAAERDIPVPGEPFTFGELEAAQAEGDRIALEGRGRPIIRVSGMDGLHIDQGKGR